METLTVSKTMKIPVELLFKLAFKMSDQEISRKILYTEDIGCVDCV